MPPVTAERSPPEFANDRRQLTSNRRFVDRGHAFDHVAVGGNQVAGFDQDQVPNLEAGAWDQPVILLVAGPGDQLGLSLGALAAQRVGLRLAASLGNSLGEVCEQDCEPQPEDDLEFEADVLAAGYQIADQDHGGQRGDDFEHEHHRILHQRARIELDERGTNGGHDDLRIEQRRGWHALAQGRAFHRGDSEPNWRRRVCRR